MRALYSYAISLRCFNQIVKFSFMLIAVVSQTHHWSASVASWEYTWSKDAAMNEYKDVHYSGHIVTYGHMRQLNGGHSIAPKIISAYAASASP